MEDRKKEQPETIWALRITGSQKRLIKDVSGLALIFALLFGFLGTIAVIKAGVCYLEQKEVTMKCVLKGYRK